VQRYIALLRGINVGGHRVAMAELRAQFEALGFRGVETFIASGNVIFDAAGGNEAQLREQIERRLRDALGYDVPTFLRTPHELAAVAAYEPFSPAQLGTDFHTLSVMFMAEAAPAGLHDALQAFRTTRDEFHVQGRELYWLCRARSSDSLVDWPLLGKRVAMPSVTVRNATTVRKLAAKYPGTLKR
jgi:uncharacterized protein (DUF1697 family)